MSEHKDTMGEADPEVIKPKYPIIPGLTEGYAPEVLEAAWAETLRLIEKYPNNAVILLNRGIEPYIFLVPIRGKPTSQKEVCFFTQEYFKYFIDSLSVTAKLLTERLTEWMLFSKPSLARLKTVCDLYLRYIHRVRPGDLKSAKEFALGLGDVVAHQPGYRNWEILEGFNYELTPENIATFKALADEQNADDVKRYYSGTDIPQERKHFAAHLATVALFVRQKDCLVGYAKEERSREAKAEEGVSRNLNHPVVFISILLQNSILISNNSNLSGAMCIEALPYYCKGSHGEAFLRDLGRLLNCNPKLQRPDYVPVNVSGELENPYGLDKKYWDKFFEACRNADRELEPITKVISGWQTSSDAFYSPKTWLSKMTYFIHGFDKVYEIISKAEKGLKDELRPYAKRAQLHCEIGFEVPAFMMLEYFVHFSSGLDKKSAVSKIKPNIFWTMYFVDDPYCFTFHKFIPYYLDKPLLAQHFQQFLQSSAKNLDKIISFALSRNEINIAFSLKILADYCQNDVDKATYVARKILENKDPYAKAKLFAFVAHFEHPEPIIHAVLALDAKSPDSTSTYEPKRKSPSLFLNLSKTEYPERDLAAMRLQIKNNRTSHISHEGNLVDVSALSCVSKKEFNTIRITKNKETKRNPKGLACNMVLTGSTEPVYLRLDAEGFLILRFLDENGATIEEFDREKFLKSGIVAEQSSGAAAFFDELNYLALEALAVVCVRRNVESRDQSLEFPLAVGTEKTGDGEEPSSTCPIITPGFPETASRKEGAMVIDLTDDEKVLRRKRQREATIRIQSNLGRIREVFAPLAQGNILPEAPPAEARNLLLHECVILDIPGDHGRVHKNERIFEAVRQPLTIYEKLRTGEIKPESVFVRTGRAFSQSLPYMQSERSITFPKDPDDPDSSIVTASYFGVRRKSMRSAAHLKREIFMDAEAGEAIKIGDMEKYLNFDVPDSPKNRALFERIKSGKDMPGMIEAIKMKIQKGLDEQRRIVRKKYLETSKPDIMKYSRIMNTLAALAKNRLSSAEQIMKETAAKAIEITEPVQTEGRIEMRTKLRLPYPGFHFDQTFNQGRFTSLAEVLGMKH